MRRLIAVSIMLTLCIAGAASLASAGLFDDIKSKLPIPDPEVTRQSAREMIDLFCPKGGGLILKDYGDYKTIQIPPENVAAMHDEFISYGANLARFYQ